MEKENTNYFILSISGNSGSGKSTIAYEVAKKLGKEKATWIPGDYYMANNRFGSVEELLKHPMEYDWKFMEEMFELPYGSKLTLPQYDFHKFERIKENGGKEFILNKIVIVDAMLPYNKANLKVFVDIDKEERYERVENRDEESGSNVLNYWQHHELSMRKVEKQQIPFNLKINATDDFDMNVQKIIQLIQKHL